MEISARNTACLIAVIIMGGTLGQGSGATGRDSWIAMLISGLFALPFILLYSAISARYPDKGLFDMLAEALGRVGNFFVFAMSLAAILLCSFELKTLTDYTAAVALSRTPPLVIALCILSVSLYLASSGVANLGKWSVVVLVIAVLNLLLTTAMSVELMRLTHLQPLANHDARLFGSDILRYAVSAFGNTVFVLTIIGEMRENPYKAFLSGASVGLAMIVAVTLRNIMVLGSELFVSSRYPSYAMTRIIKLKNFVEHIETPSAFVEHLIGITKIALFLRTASSGMARLLGSDERRRLLTVGLASLLPAIGLAAVGRAVLLPIYCSYALSFCLLIPVVSWVFSGERKSRRSPD